MAEALNAENFQGTRGYVDVLAGRLPFMTGNQFLEVAEVAWWEKICVIDKTACQGRNIELRRGSYRDESDGS